MIEFSSRLQHQSDGSPVRLVLLPGFMLDEALWPRFIELLPASWQIQSLSLPRGDTINAMATGVAKQLAAPSIVLGFSMGGYVARATAARFPHLVKAVVLVASSSREDDTVARQSEVGQASAVFKGIARAAIRRSLSLMNESDDALVNSVQAMSLRLGKEEYAWQRAVDRRGTPLAAIRCPTLVVAAKDDRLRSLEESKALATAIPGATLEVLEGTGHLVPLEAPAALAESLKTWIASL
ncbi:alpha/beta hydrolase [Luteimonas sp. RC10]|uniref:alpha/beta fold hydrolase n=1 Tax=Luteimonas sp. RC10 TaxID=2587035 RepID=UPI00161B165C|nr:alpha/beta hydrolase [Luteimonas sp. RC10]MBB3344789.1 pimeloyl-ACP methyl ester carboxylesterase [Luteimonas sp. RC10]